MLAECVLMSDNCVPGISVCERLQLAMIQRDRLKTMDLPGSPDKTGRYRGKVTYVRTDIDEGISLVEILSEGVDDIDLINAVVHKLNRRIELEIELERHAVNVLAANAVTGSNARCGFYGDPLKEDYRVCEK